MSADQSPIVPPRVGHQANSAALAHLDLTPPASLAPRLDATRSFIDEVALPLEAQFLAGGWHAVEGAIAGGRAEARRRGLWAPQLPTALGGGGLGLVEVGYISEVLGQSIFGHLLSNMQAPDAGTMELLLDHASAEQRERFLEPLAAGQIRSCFGMTEPDFAGSNPVWMGTTARRVGDGWVLDGRKWFTSSAEGAAVCLVMALSDPQAAPHRRASLFLVPTDTPGFRLVRNLPVMGEVGGGWMSHGEVALEGCRVGDDAVVGRLGEGFALAQARLGPGRIHHCMRWMGIAARAFDLMCRRAVDRELAPGQPLANRQLVQAAIALSRAEIDAARGLVLHAAAKIERAGAKAARLDISLIKFFAAGVLERVLDRAIQVHGGLGITDLTPLAWWYRHERGARIYDGADEVHQTAAARQILRGYGWVPPAGGDT